MIEAVPCPSHSGSVDIRDSRYPDDVLHASAAEWAAFANRLKSGTYDETGRADRSTDGCPPASDARQISVS
jgi:hypothetical protein